MATDPKLTNLAANTAADDVCALCNGGFLDIYDGTQPATADTAITTQVLLASLQFSNPAFSAAVAGVATANTINEETDAPATGNASWFRVYKSDHTTAVEDGSVGAVSGFNINLNTIAIAIHSTVSITSLTYTQAKS